MPVGDLAQQPLAARAVDAAEPYHRGALRGALAQQRLGLQQDPAGESARLGGRVLVDPFAVMLVVDAGARCQQHGRLAAQRAQQVREPVDVDASIVGLVEAAGGAGDDDDVEMTLAEGRERGRLAQVRRQRLYAGRQQPGATPQPDHAMAGIAQPLGQRATHIAATGYQYVRPVHRRLPLLHWAIIAARPRRRPAA